jgi:hypothetical protein
MKPATRTGLAMNAVCDPLIDSVTAPIRLAMNRSASGGIALSCSDTKNHDGLVFHPAVAFSVSAAADTNESGAVPDRSSRAPLSLNPGGGFRGGR